MSVQSMEKSRRSLQQPQERLSDMIISQKVPGSKTGGNILPFTALQAGEPSGEWQIGALPGVRKNAMI